MALIDNMIALNARLTAIPIRFGVPQYQPLLIRHITLGATATEPTIADTLIEPQPMIKNVSPNQVAYKFGDGALELREDDYMVTGIPRTYSREFLRDDVEWYAIAPTIVDGVVQYDEAGHPVGAERCKCIYVDDGKLLTWELVLRKLKDGFDTSDTAGLF